MATRRTIHILKNSVIPSQSLPSSGVKPGEPLINLGDGILFFSGGTAGAPTWVPSDNNVNYFEVGSNLYDLKLRNQLIEYQGINGSGLIGKFLSGTTTGFVLADISSIQGSATDSYVTGGTNTSATNNTNTASIGLKYNQSIPDGTYTLPYTDSYTTGSTLNGSIVSFYRNDGSSYSVDLGTLSPTGFTDTYVTGFTKSGNILTILRNQGEPNLTVDLSTLDSITINGSLTVTGTTQTKDLNVTNFVTSNLIPETGCTYDLGSTTNRWNDVWAKKVKIGTCTTDLEDNGSQFIITVGGTSSGATINLNGGDLNVGGDVLPIGDLTYNIGEPLNRWNNVYAGNISASAITISNLAPNRVVYTNGSGSLATETGFEYDESTDRMTVGALTVNNATGTTSYIGQGGLQIGSGGSTSSPGIGDLIVHGNLDVFGTTTTISTSELYIEDPQITLNYNPTGNTSPTSIASGFKIQDGAGVVSTDVYLTIAQMNTFTGGDVTEYSGPTGYANRAWLTQLNDIVIRNTNLNNGAPDGVRVLAEFDCLDGGTY